MSSSQPEVGAAGAWSLTSAPQVARWQMVEAAEPQLGRRQARQGGPLHSWVCLNRVGSSSRALPQS